MTHAMVEPDTQQPFHAVTRRDALRRAVRSVVTWSTIAGVAGVSAACTRSTTAGRVGQPIPQPLPRSPKAGLLPGSITRESWARFGPRRGDARRMGAVRRITIHHDAMDVFTATGARAAAERLEAIRVMHVGGRGWADIGYHFAVDPAGRVWQCRPIDLQGAHVKDQNPHNVGILVMGHFEQQEPTPAACGAIDRTVAQLMRRYRLGSGDVWTHQELAATLCPGRNLQRYLDVSRSPSGAIGAA